MALTNGGWEYLCSGFFITTDGYIGTAGHCVSSNAPLSVEYKSRVYSAILIDIDRKHDVAIYKIAAINTPALPIGTPSKIGDTVFILGYPIPNWLGYNLKIHRGRVTNIWPAAYISNGASCEGNSGGPVVNSKNQVIGVLTAGFGSNPCSNSTYIVKIYYIELLAQKHKINLYREVRLLDISKETVYNNDINSVVLIYKLR